MAMPSKPTGGTGPSVKKVLYATHCNECDFVRHSYEKYDPRTYLCRKCKKLLGRKFAAPKAGAAAIRVVK
jgi:hypothetical protein